MHVFCFDLPHSDAPFVKADPALTALLAFLDSASSSFAFFGGVPLSILYDNTKLAVARTLVAGQRTRTRAWSGRLVLELSVLGFAFGRPGKGNDKGKVEGLVKYTQRTFMTPLPHAASFEVCDRSRAGRDDRVNMLAGMLRQLLPGGLCAI